MPFNKLPLSFFGADFSVASSGITLGTASKTSGTTAATFTAAPVANEITTVAAHNLKPGDAIRFTGAAVGGITLTSTTYYVKTIGDTAGVYNKLTISNSLNGAVVALSGGGGGTTTIAVLGLLNDVVDSEAAPATTGDWRRVVAGIMEMFYRKWVGTPAADRPAKLTINRTPVVDTTTGEIVVTYTVRVVNAPAPLEVADE